MDEIWDLHSYYETLRELHDYLLEESSFYDARSFLSPLRASSTSFPFAVTLIEQVESVSKAMDRMDLLSQIPAYVLSMIYSRLSIFEKTKYRRCYQYTTSHTVFVQDPEGPSVFSAFSYHLVLRMTVDRKYAFILSIFGIEFQCTDPAASREYRRRKKIEKMYGDESQGEFRRERQLRRDKWSKSSMSLDSQSQSDAGLQSAVEVFDHWDEVVDRHFETHIVQDTMPRLRIKIYDEDLIDT